MSVYSPVSDLLAHFDAVDELLRELLPLAEADQVQRLEDLGDATLAAHVGALLEAERDERLAHALEAGPGVERVTAFFPEDGGSAGEGFGAVSLEGERVGPWRLGRVLGEGGMGVVYEGERDDGTYEQRVAVKFVRLSASPQARWRFERERRLLARLTHPHIARLLGGGVTERGDPYLVMEFAAGTPITDYADAQRLGVRERVQLLQSVCRAVQHAHARFVVHRDLKPSNVLVDQGEEGGEKGTAQPKLLDFGVATLTDVDAAGADADEAFRTVEAAPHTPAYAAPEQIRGEAATAQTDVYALGVLLYELLAGTRPHEAAAEASPGTSARRDRSDRRARKQALAQRVLEETAPRPSQAASETAAVTRGATPERLRRSLRGDLDAICLKALEKDPARRYASAEAFAEDLGRYLGGLPVEAQVPSLGYRAARFVRRRRLPVALGALAFLALLTFSAVLAFQQSELRAERNAAQAEAAKAEEVVGYLVSLFAAADPNESLGADVTARELLERGRERLTELEDQPEVQAELSHALARVHNELGEFDGARSLAESAIATWRRMGARVSVDLATTLTLLGTVAWEQGELDDAAEALTEATAILAAQGEDLRLSDALLGFGIAQQAAGNLAAADSLIGLALEARHRALGDEPDESLPSMYATLGLVRVNQARYVEGDSLYRIGLALAREVFGGEHPEVTNNLYNLANLNVRMGRSEEAEPLLREVLALDRKQLGERHPYVAYTLGSLGGVLGDLQRYDEGEALLREAVSINREALGEAHPQTAYRMMDLASLLSTRGDPQEALDAYERALAVLREAHPDGHFVIATALHNMGSTLNSMGDYDRALLLLREALELRTRLLGEDHGGNGTTLAWMGDAYAGLGREGEARSAYERSLAILEATLPEDHPRLASTREKLAAL
jgi:serine/threonine-protein kinase